MLLLLTSETTERDLLVKELQLFWKLQPFCLEVRRYQMGAPQPFQDKQMRFSYKEKVKLTTQERYEEPLGRTPMVTVWYLPLLSTKDLELPEQQLDFAPSKPG